MATYRVSKGITRYELDSTHSDGFMVRLHRNGAHVNEFFSENTYGGLRKAKKAAQVRYAELEELHGQPNKKSTEGKLTSRNSTGHVGIHIAHSIEHRWGGLEYFSYCASWVSDEGQRQKISFAWNRYGKKLALKMACYAREKKNNKRAVIVAKFEADMKAYTASQERVAKKLRKAAAAGQGTLVARGRVTASQNRLERDLKANLAESKRNTKAKGNKSVVASINGGIVTTRQPKSKIISKVSKVTRTTSITRRKPR